MEEPQDRHLRFRQSWCGRPRPARAAPALDNSKDELSHPLEDPSTILPPNPQALHLGLNHPQTLKSPRAEAEGPCLAAVLIHDFKDVLSRLRILRFGASLGGGGGGEGVIGETLNPIRATRKTPEFRAKGLDCGKV